MTPAITDTIAVEKLDGTNVKLQTKNSRLIALQNRKNIIDPMQILKGKAFIVEGVFMSIQKGYVEDNQIQAGEVIGPKLQGNPYQLNTHLWYPFAKAVKHLKYRSFHEHERNFDNFSSWFKDHLKSLFHTKKVGYENAVWCEFVCGHPEVGLCRLNGVIFVLLAWIVCCDLPYSLTKKESS